MAEQRLPSPTPIRGLLRCLDAGFFISSFEDEGYKTLGDLREDGEETVAEFMSCLCMPRGADKRLQRFAFPQDNPADAAPSESTTASAVEEKKLAAEAIPRSSQVFDMAWLQTVAPLYNLKMGCENMGPLLYSLTRFVKPSHCLEIGAGYTSAFLLQALADNAAEAKAWQTWSATVGQSAQNSWLAACHGSLEETPTQPLLHCVDNWAHEGSTAPPLFAVARKLKLLDFLSLHVDDARAFVEESEDVLPPFDLVWLDGLLDFASAPTTSTGSSGAKGGEKSTPDIGRGIDDFLKLLWPRVRPGGLVLLHSTLTNTVVRKWLAGVDAAPWGPPGSVLSLLEPGKRFQNSVTILQRRPDGYQEPIYSNLP